MGLSLSITAQTTKRVYFIGNSVTDVINYSGLRGLASQRGITQEHGRHMIPGAPLDWIWGHAGDGVSEPPYGLYGNALPNFPWDILSLQPFDRPLNSDRTTIGQFINMAKGPSPNLQVYLYSRWPRKTSGFPIDANGWNQLWERIYGTNNESFNNNECKDYFEKLIIAVRNANFISKQPLMVPVGDVMYALNNKMKNGQVPGYSSVWQFYPDDIHLNGTGSYLVACTYLATIYKADPRGLTIPPDFGTVDASIKDVIQATVWEVVSTHLYSGVGTGVAVTGVTLNTASLTINAGNTATLIAAVQPSNATNKNVNWSSSNTAIAQVNSSGVVTGIAQGNATITVTTVDGNKTAFCSVKVDPGITILVTSVTVNPPTLSIKVGSASQLTTSVLPSDATNKNLSWSSNNTARATVDATGKVTAVGVGAVSITATSQDGSNKSGSCAITVTANNPPTAVLDVSSISDLVVSFNANGSSDPDAGDFILGYEWNFGDGSALSNANAPTHTYTNAGTYTATLRVMDNNNLFGSTVTKAITVTSTGFTKVTGTAFGTAPWANCPTCTFDKAFDNNTSTYFDAAAANGAYTGIDAGTGQMIKRLRYYPRAGNEIRMAGGKFQGSNTSNSAGYVDLYTIPSAPTLAWQLIDITNTTAYRYLRYLAPNNGYGNVAEVEFYISGTSNNLTVSPATLSFGSAAGSSNVTVTSNVSWAVSDNQTWISVSPASGLNNGTVAVSVAANTTSISRTGTLTVTGGSITQNINITQSGTSSGTTTYLSDLTWVSSTNGYGPVEKDKSNGENGPTDGHTITLNGVTYTKGLGVHANSTIIYNLGGMYNRFLSDIGLDDEITDPNCGSVGFEVYLDNVIAYTSAGAMTGTTPTKIIDIDVTGKNQLRLVVTDGGNGTSCDHGDWAGARLITSAARISTASLSVREEETALEERVSVYPNPVKENVLNADIYSDRNVNAKITMLSSTLQLVVDVQQALVKGHNTIQIPVDHLRNGLHFLIINKGHERIVKKVIIDR